MVFKFDLTEFISFIAVSIGLIIILYSYFFKKPKNSSNQLLDKHSVRIMLIIFLFIFFNRLFTNVEALAYKSFFNLLEHLSSSMAGIMSMILSWSVFRGVKN